MFVFQVLAVKMINRINSISFDDPYLAWIEINVQPLVDEIIAFIEYVHEDRYIQILVQMIKEARRRLKLILFHYRCLKK